MSDKVITENPAPGCTIIKVEKAFGMWDGTVRVGCDGSEEDGVWLARLLDTDPPKHVTFAVTGAGDTKEQALAHLAIAYYTCAIPDEPEAPDAAE